MSVWMKRALSGLLATLLLAAPVFASIQTVRIEGDANGDGVVDFRDVQIIVAGLKGAPVASSADVNHDGVVDVRDLQFVLARSTLELRGTEQQPTSDATNGSVPLTRPFRVFQEVGYVHILADANDLSLRPGQESLQTIPGPTPPGRTIRLMFGISPHAPPVMA